MPYISGQTEESFRCLNLLLTDHETTVKTVSAKVSPNDYPLQSGFQHVGTGGQNQPSGEAEADDQLGTDTQGRAFSDEEEHA